MVLGIEVPDMFPLPLPSRRFSGIFARHFIDPMKVTTVDSIPEGRMWMRTFYTFPFFGRTCD